MGGGIPIRRSSIEIISSFSALLPFQFQIQLTDETLVWGDIADIFMSLGSGVLVFFIPKIYSPCRLSWLLLQQGKQFHATISSPSDTILSPAMHMAAAAKAGKHSQIIFLVERTIGRTFCTVCHMSSVCL